VHPPGASADNAFACTCAKGQLRTIFDKGRLDNGWTGTSHKTATVSNTDFDTLLFDCDGLLDDDCQQTGPRHGKYGFRCELNPRIVCTTDADCAGRPRTAAAAVSSARRCRSPLGACRCA
jgi:hypothetical protein